MSSKFYVGGDVISSTDNGKYKPISRVTLYLDDNNCLTAGDDTGHEIVADCPHATQEMVNALLANLKGHEYQAFEADEANIDPAAELGDGITVGGVYGGISRMMDDGMGYPSLSAPGEAELEDEYPMEGPLTRMFNRELAKTYSLIAKSAEEIRLEVHGVEDALSYIELDLDSITSRVQDAEGNISTLEQTATSLRSDINGKIDGEDAQSLIDQSLQEIVLSVSSSSGSSTFKLTADGVTLSTKTLDLSVKAAKISGLLQADQLNLTGAITFGDLDEDTQLAISDAYTMAYNNQLPSYIKSTYIDSVSIQSPSIIAGTFFGNEFNVLSETSGGSFNLYGKYYNSYVHALEIAYSAGDAPVVYFGGTIARFSFGAVYFDCGIDLGMNDVSFYNGSYITSLREIEARLTALESK